MAELPEIARRYLDELAFELRFAPKYAENIRQEIGGHFDDVLSCGERHDMEQAAIELTRGFGSPQCLAAEFAAVLITRKLRNTLFFDLLIIVMIGLAVFDCLTGRQGGPAVLLACASGGIAWAGLLGSQHSRLSGVRLRHRLCLSMAACHLTSLSLAFSLIWNLYMAKSASGLYPDVEVIAVVLLLGRQWHLRRRGRMMCELWQRASRCSL